MPLPPRILADRRAESGKSHVAQDRQGGSDERRGRPTSNSGAARRGPRDGRKPPWSGSDSARRSQPRDANDAAAQAGPPIPAEIEAKQLAPEIRGELTTLDKLDGRHGRASPRRRR